MKNTFKYIAIILFILFIAIMVYAQDYSNTKVEQEKETRINNIEYRLDEQMNYIHGLEADVDNLKEVLSK